VAKKRDQDRSRQVTRATQPLSVGAFGAISGIACSVLGAEEIGSMLTLAGLGMLLWGLHRLGRLGADPPRAKG
jgi:hypothetical protein